jgi:uncharacterized protein (TIGR00297 family)
MPHETHEGLRKALHIGFGFGAFALHWLPWQIAAAVAAAAVLGNWLVLPRLVGKQVARHERGWDAGIVLYPLMVLILILVFRHQLVNAAVGWAVMAFGDGMATVVGRSFPIAALPWNRAKSWGGSLAFVVGGFASLVAVVRLFGAPLTAAIMAALVIAAIMESMPLGVNDNIVVPVAVATVLLVFAPPLLHGAVAPPIRWGWLAVNTVLAIMGYLLRTVDLSGMISGWLLGDIIILGAGGSLYIALLTFFIIGTACTRFGYARKARLGLAEEKGGRRGAAHGLANVGVAAICAVAAWRQSSLLPLFMGIASLATAAADTTASEIGQLFGRHTFLPLTFRRVERGTEGAISIEGTLAGALAALIVAIAGTTATISRLAPGFAGYVVIDKSHTIVTLTVCAIVGSWLESVAGSWNRKQEQPMPSGVLNFFNTAMGAILFVIAAQFVPMFGFMFF